MEGAVGLSHPGYGDGLETTELVELGQPTLTRYAATRKTITDVDIRCRCNRLLAELAGRPWRIRCGRCKTLNTSPESPE